MFCRKCGTQLPDDAMFCGECGAATRNHQSQQQAGQQPYQEPPYQGYANQPPYQDYPGGQPYQQQYQQPNYGPYPGNGSANVKAKFSGGSKRTIITVAIIAAIAVAVGLLYNFVLKTGNPEDTIKDLEAAIEDLDLEKMIDCFDEDTRQMYEESMSQFGDVDMDQALTSALGLAGGLGIGPEVDIKVTDIQYTDSVNCEVYVDIKISFLGESEETSGEVIPMTKEGKRWVIDGSVADDIMGGLF